MRERDGCIVILVASATRTSVAAGRVLHTHDVVVGRPVRQVRRIRVGGRGHTLCDPVGRPGCETSRGASVDVVTEVRAAGGGRGVPVECDTAGRRARTGRRLHAAEIRQQVAVTRRRDLGARRWV